MDVAPASLEAVLDRVWALLSEGAEQRRSPFHQGVLASLSGAGPEARHVVLRAAQRESGTLEFHTDARSPKCVQLAADSRASWCFYGGDEQLRCSGHASILVRGERVEQAWSATGPWSRSEYLSGQRPGEALDRSDTDASEDLLARPPSLESGVLGRAHFAVVEFHIERVDWLRLARSGHQRAVFAREDDWRGCWLQP